MKLPKLALPLPKLPLPSVSGVAGSVAGSAQKLLGPIGLPPLPLSGTVSHAVQSLPLRLLP